MKHSQLSVLAAAALLWATACNDNVGAVPDNADSELDSTDSAPDSTGEGAACDQSAWLAVRADLEQYCYKCHGQNGTAFGNMNFILDLSKLVERGLVIPYDSANSRIVARIVEGSMPPTGEQDRPDQTVVEDMQSWIDGCGAEAFDEASPRDFIGLEDALVRMSHDLLELPVEDQEYARYFSLVNLHDDPGISDDDLSTYRHGLNKLVNDLSQGDVIVIPQPIDEYGALYRIDLRDYGWDAEVDGEDRWDVMLEQYPYGVHFPDNVYAEFLYSGTGSPMPFVNADWFVFQASEPPLYYDMHRMPSTVDDLMDDLEVEKGISSCSGLVNSGVSTNNRTVCRSPAKNGMCWESYDFASSVGDKNILTSPLPPGAGNGDFENDPDGGEYICSLPNGLHMFAIANAKGTIIDEAPVSIVSDHNDPLDPAVRSGRKCSKCHAEGINPAADRVREFVQMSELFPADVVNYVLAHYPPANEFDAIVAQDQEAFLAARAATGIPANIQGNGSVPVSFMADAFKVSVSIDRAAADFWLPADEFRQRVEDSEDLLEIFGPLLIEGGALKRDAFRDAYPLGVCALGLGDNFINGEAVPCSDGGDGDP